MKSPFAASVAFVGALCTLAGCYSAPPLDPTASGPLRYHKADGPWYVEPGVFTHEQENEISAATAEWSVDTGGQFIIDVVFGAPTAGKARIITNNPPIGYTGWWAADDYDAGWMETISIVTPEPDNQSTKYIAMHEFGHGLGCAHVDDPDSVMHSGGTATCLSSFDIATLCAPDVNDCDQNNLHPCR